MKLYLSSVGILDITAFEELVGKPAGEIKMGIIFNAMDYKDPETRFERYSKTITGFHKLGIGSVTEIDLRSTAEINTLRAEILKYDVIWLNGGNVYLLRWYLQNSGFDALLKDINVKGIIIGGDSAGAVVVGPTLKHYETADDPEVAPEPIYEGLKLIDTAIIPHWGSDEYRAVLGNIETKLHKDGFMTKRLTDEECLVINT